MLVKKIEVYSVKEVSTNDGKKFKTYKAVTKSGKLIDLKFTRDCVGIPAKPCYIYVRPEMMNVQKNLKYPCLWVKAIEKAEDFPSKLDEDLFD